MLPYSYTSILNTMIKEKLKNLYSHLRDNRQGGAELEFLPAALEVLETPPSPFSRVIIWTIITFFLIAIIWACLGKVDIVAIAQGKIVPGERVKIIQPLEAGIVKAIHVEEGQRVKAGQPLIEFDSTVSGADKQRLHGEWIRAEFDHARLKALIDNVGQQKIEAPGIDQYFDTSVLPYLDPNAIALSQQHLTQQYNEYLSQASSLRQQVLERAAELNSAEEQIQRLDATIPLITERANAVKKVLESGVVSRADWLKVEEERINQVKQRDVLKSDRVRLQAAIENAKQQSQALSAKYQSTWMGELAEIRNRLEASRQELVKAEQRNDLQILTSPVEGRVQQLAMHTIGGVVTPAQELMRIVPEDGALEVEAWLENKDIGFVEKGQAAEIKVETFPFTKYGIIPAEVETVSLDATPDENLGLVYTLQARMLRSTMQVNDKLITLAPGMAVTVEVKTGTRRIIEYLLSPVLKYKDESIQER
jgi:hemolysin D